MTHFLVIDASVMVYNFLNNLQTNAVYDQLYLAHGRNAQDLYIKKVGQLFVKHLSSGEWLPARLKHADTVPVWAWDTKDTLGEYWRHAYLREQGLPIKYKAGRKDKTDTWYKCRDAVKHAVTTMELTSFEYEGYEADDIAGAIVKLAGSDPVTLLTVDTDWLGLLSPTCTWVSSTNYAPQVRNNLTSFNSWCQKRLKAMFHEPTQLWTYKAIHGDKSDNLPRKSPLAVINLLEPPPKYDLTQNGLMFLPANMRASASIPGVTPELARLQGPLVSVEWSLVNDLPYYTMGQ